MKRAILIVDYEGDEPPFPAVLPAGVVRHVVADVPEADGPGFHENVTAPMLALLARIPAKRA